MGALADRDVGKYLNAHFVASYQKVGAFRIANGQKQGGNVASYFCTADGRVLHVVAGPVNAGVLLREARWVVETCKLARLEKKDEGDALRAFVGKAHAERLKWEHGVSGIDAWQSGSKSTVRDMAAFLEQPENRHRSLQGKVHVMLAHEPLPAIESIYRVVFEKILEENVTTNPVQMAQMK